MHPDLRNLRRVRVYTHKQIDRLEPQLDRLKARLAEVEAEIQAIAPELMLPPRRHKPNPIFPRGEFTRTLYAVLREAGEPLPMTVIAIRMLSLKGLDMPEKAVREATFYRASTTLSVLHGQGRVVMTGNKRDAKWALG
jgi:hypothetical protein